MPSRVFDIFQELFELTQDTPCSSIRLRNESMIHIVLNCEESYGMSHIYTISPHRCWWGMLEMKCVGNNYQMLVTVLAILVTNIRLLYSYKNIQKMSPTSTNVITFRHQHHGHLQNVSFEHTTAFTISSSQSLLWSDVVRDSRNRI